MVNGYNHFMMIKKITAILFSLMLCFCLLSKQTVQTAHIAFDIPVLQDAVAEDLNLDDMDVNDEVILSTTIFGLPLFFIVLAIVFVRRYSQPIIPTPKRPPSF